MGNEIDDFVSKAREQGLHDGEIKARLLAVGWSEADVNGALQSDAGSLNVPKPPNSPTKTKTVNYDQTIVPLDSSQRNLKSKVFEYNIMFVTLWIVAIATIWIVNVFLFTSSTTAITFPLTADLVCVPIFLFFFFRTRELERRDETLKFIPGRLHLVQSTMTLSFVILIVHTIFCLYQVLNGSDSVSQQIVSWLGTVLIFGSIFGYYWHDTHSAKQS